MLKKNGFTYIEIAIVISILGIIFSLAFPNYRLSRRTNRLYAEARKLSMDIQFMREISFSHQEETKLLFINDEAYKITRDNEEIKTVYFEAGIKKKTGPDEITFKKDGLLLSEADFFLTNYYEDIKVSANTTGKVDVKWEI